MQKMAIYHNGLSLAVYPLWHQCTSPSSAPSLDMVFAINYIEINYTAMTMFRLRWYTRGQHMNDTSGALCSRHIVIEYSISYFSSFRVFEMQADNLPALTVKHPI